jgi:3-phenylpropionate/cinnamic acid dioxygenase small subunit
MVHNARQVLLSMKEAPVTDVDPADALAIRDVLIRYATAIDTKDWTLLRGCFADDCTVRYGRRRWHDANTLVQDFAAAHDPLDETMHRVLNIAVDASADDKEVASARSLCDALLIRVGAVGGDVLQVWGVYTDRLRRINGDDWRIADREFRAVRYHGALAVLGDDIDQQSAGFGDALND